MRHPLVQDLALGLALMLLLVVSPFTPGAWTPSLLMGAGAGAALVVYRVVARRRAPEPAQPEAGARAEALPWHAPARVWLAVAALAAIFAPTGRWLYESWTASIWQNAHGILIPVVMGYMIYAILRRDDDPTPRHSAWGFAFLVPGLLLVAADSALRTRQLAALGLVLALPGLCLLLLGSRRTRRLAIPLLLGLFMIPIPNTVAAHLYLKKATASLVAPLLSVVGVPVVREETLLFLPNATFLVADACSGFSTLYAAVGVAVVLAAYARTWGRRLLLLVSAWPLAVACNVARVTLLVGVANHFGLGLLDTPFHAASGVATFWAVLVALILIADRRALRETYA